MRQRVQAADSRIIWPPEHSPASSMVFAQNTIEIAASPERVWSQLIDCVRGGCSTSIAPTCRFYAVARSLSANAKLRFKTL